MTGKPDPSLITQLSHQIDFFITGRFGFFPRDRQRISFPSARRMIDAARLFIGTNVCRFVRVSASLFTAGGGRPGARASTAARDPSLVNDPSSACMRYRWLSDLEDWVLDVICAEDNLRADAMLFQLSHLYDIGFHSCLYSKWSATVYGNKYVYLDLQRAVP